MEPKPIFHHRGLPETACFLSYDVDGHGNATLNCSLGFDVHVKSRICLLKLQVSYFDLSSNCNNGNRSSGIDDSRERQRDFLIRRRAAGVGEHLLATAVGQPLLQGAAGEPLLAAAADPCRT
jgi:hypothetical protein